MQYFLRRKVVNKTQTIGLVSNLLSSIKVKNENHICILAIEKLEKMLNKLRTMHKNCITFAESLKRNNHISEKQNPFQMKPKVNIPS